MTNIARNFCCLINRDWRYDWKLTLSEDLTLEVNLAMPAHCPAFNNLWVHLESVGPNRVQITVRKGYSWDGCSIVPDAPGTRKASCVHDAIYQFAEAIATAFGWPVREVLRWADETFLQVMRQDHCPVAKLYYVGVRLFGGAFHSLARWLREEKP